MFNPHTWPAVPKCSFFPWEICPPFGIDVAIIVSPGRVNPEYIARFATTPEVARQSANSALKTFLASSLQIISTWSIKVQPAYTLSPGHPSAYLFPKSDTIASLTAVLGIFSLAINGIELANQSWWLFINSKILL